MKVNFKVLLLLVATLLPVFLSSGPVFAQTTDSRFFAETGHNVSGDFWNYYQSVPQARLVFGYPLTEAYTDFRSGRLVQYFTRARFEYFPEFPEGQRVRLTNLGKLLYQPGSSLNKPEGLGCRAFATGFSSCYAFLEFFEANGDEAVFGAPISSFEFYNGRIVQYFENARFEWYPELQEGQKVILADAGRIYFDSEDEDANLLSPFNASNIAENILNVRVLAFVKKATTGANDEQTLYVVVQDQTLAPVRNAFVVVTVTWAGGAQQSISLPTNENGVVVLPFAVTEQTHGSLILIKVQALYEGLQANTKTSFRVWQ